MSGEIPADYTTGLSQEKLLAAHELAWQRFAVEALGEGVARGLPSRCSGRDSWAHHF